MTRGKNKTNLTSETLFRCRLTNGDFAQETIVCVDYYTAYAFLLAGAYIYGTWWHGIVDGTLV